MTCKQIEGAREVRLWVTQLVIPGITLGLAVTKPETISNAVNTVKWKARVLKEKIQDKMQRP